MRLMEQANNCTHRRDPVPRQARNGRPAEWRRAECVLTGMHYKAHLG
jgi:hypothetical protein